MGWHGFRSHGKLKKGHGIWLEFEVSIEPQERTYLLLISFVLTHLFRQPTKIEVQWKHPWGYNLLDRRKVWNRIQKDSEHDHQSMIYLESLMCSERDASTDRRTVDFGKAKKGSRNSTCAASLTMNFIRSMRFHGVGPSSDPQRVAKKTIAKKRGLRLAVYRLYTLAVPASGVACLLWFITIHHFIMLYGTIWHHNQVLICQRDAGRSSCSFTACPSRFDGWSHWWTGWWRVQVSYQWVVELWLSTHRPMPRMCTMDDDIWLLPFRKKLWPPGMEEWQAYWDGTQWASQQKAWARTRLFFGLYSILNICILHSCLSHIPTYLYSIEIWHVHRIYVYIYIYIYTYTHMHVQIRTYMYIYRMYANIHNISANTGYPLVN